jgi:putative addiction module antidote
MLKLALRRTGNSVGLVLPKEALDHLGAREADTVFLTFVAEGALRLSKEDPAFESKVQAAEKINQVYGDAVRALIRRKTAEVPCPQ